MNPLFRIDLSISDSLKTVRKSVLIYETIIESSSYHTHLNFIFSSDLPTDTAHA